MGIALGAVYGLVQSHLVTKAAVRLKIQSMFSSATHYH